MWVAAAWGILWLNSMLLQYGSQIPLFGDLNFGGINAGAAAIFAVVLYVSRKYTP